MPLAVLVPWKPRAKEQIWLPLLLNIELVGKSKQKGFPRVQHNRLLLHNSVEKERGHLPYCFLILHLYVPISLFCFVFFFLKTPSRRGLVSHCETCRDLRLEGASGVQEVSIPPTLGGQGNLSWGVDVVKSPAEMWGGRGTHQWPGSLLQGSSEHNNVAKPERERVDFISIGTVVSSPRLELLVQKEQVDRPMKGLETKANWSGF